METRQRKRPRGVDAWVDSGFAYGDAQHSAFEAQGFYTTPRFLTPAAVSLLQ